MCKQKTLPTFVRTVKTENVAYFCAHNEKPPRFADIVFAFVLYGFCQLSFGLAIV